MYRCRIASDSFPLLYTFFIARYKLGIVQRIENKGTDGAHTA
jgi:hypothetical protein